MKKTIYIHIGRPKVGSTAIQRFLKTNRKVLLENDFLYPRTGERQSASHQLAAVLFGDVKKQNASSAETLYEELFSEIEGSVASNCILSSENFYFVKPHRLARLLSKKFDVRILCYVRRQDQVLVSSYIQELRDDTLAGDERDDMDRYLSRPDRIRFLDYEIMMDAWAEAFGEDNVIVRVYEKGQLKGDLFSDVMDAIGLPLTAEYDIPRQRVNPTPASDVLKLIRQVNHYPASELIKRQIKTQLVEISENLGYQDRFDATRMFSMLQKRDILARFRKSNAATARKYLKRDDGHLFYEDVDANEECNGGQAPAHEKFEMERMTQIWLGMIAYQQQQFNKLELQLNILRKSLAEKK